ncbi:hypothetical protein A9Q99_17240 [Gammaproteobacteria bacterium 45_16_T64]|nr:hypothetical protein A9Q99_17240 [Gammaproteobacteria bacterium 45_16_T64]
MKSISVFLMALLLWGCSSEPEFEHYGVFVKGVNGHQALEGISKRNADEMASRTTQLVIEDNRVRFYIYQKDFSADNVQLQQMDMVSRRTVILDAKVIPRDQADSYVVSAEVMTNELPIFVLTQKTSLLSKTVYMAAAVNVEDYFVDAVLSGKVGNSSRKISDVKDLLKTFPKNARLLEEQAAYVAEQKKRKEELKRQRDELDEATYQETIAAEKAGEPNDVLIAAYDYYLRQFFDGKHKAEFVKKADGLRSKMAADRKKQRKAERKLFSELALSFASAVDKRDVAKISAITLEKSTASRVLKNNLFDRVKVGSTTFASYKLHGNNKDSVQIQLEGGIFMVRAKKVGDKWRINDYAAKSGKWFKNRG